ncbi:hypothetical protein [Duganella vulcania]|nr:hypothetical protein [Duganella vulcania]
MSVTLLNVGAVALWTGGVFASLYAGVLDPQLLLVPSAALIVWVAKAL